MTTFTTPCFIENTPEAREWLEAIGYIEIYDGFKPMIYTNRHESSWFYSSTTILDDFPRGYVDCRGNFELFKAITALREDSMFMQWFVNDMDWGMHHKKGQWFICNHRGNNLMVERILKGHYHKATPEELTEHFKNK